MDTNVHQWEWGCRYLEAAIRTSGRATRLRGTSIRVPVEKGSFRLQRLTRTSVLTQTAPEGKSLVQIPTIDSVPFRPSTRMLVPRNRVARLTVQLIFPIQPEPARKAINILRKRNNHPAIL